MASILRTENLISGYDGIEIVRNINLTISEGEIVSLIGRNGVGKSTLMKTIMGAITPMQGRIFVDEIDFTRKAIYERVNAGVCFVEQGHGIFPDLTVEENLVMGSKEKKRKGIRNFEHVYEQFPILEKRKHQRAGTLSGGEQAMLSVARALVSDPKIIILDEPSEGVQPNVVTQIGDILIRCNKEMHITILLVEQNIRLIQQVSNICCAMVKGEIVEILNKEKIKDNDEIMKYLTV